MFTSRSNGVLIPLIRTAATIGFAVAPCSLGFVIIAVSEQLIRSIIVGDDPEMLVSDLQKKFPSERIEATPSDPALVAKVIELIDHPEEALDAALDIRGAGFHSLVWDALRKVPAGGTFNYTFLAEQIRGSSSQR